MLQTIEVEIDHKGHIHALEKFPLPFKGKSRALLTLLPTATTAEQKAALTPAAGILRASQSVSLDEMKYAIRMRGGNL